MGAGGGINLVEGAVINNEPNATFAVVDIYGPSIGGDGTGGFNNYGTLTSTSGSANIGFPFSNAGP